MARKKPSMSYITNAAVRRVTFQKRKSGLVKKLYELSVLCGIEVCLIMYGPFMVEPFVWPSELAAKNTIARLKSMPESSQTDRIVNQENFLSTRLRKEKEKLMKLKKQNKEKEEMQLLYSCLNGSGLQYMNPMDLNNLRLLVEKYERDVVEQMQRMAQITNLQPPSGESINPMEMIGQSSNNMDTVNYQGNMISSYGLSSSSLSIPNVPWNNSTRNSA